jgi:sugar lactone lactonase YvrE
MRADLLLDAGAELGEGPVWDGDRAEVLWVDILVGEVHATTLDGGDRVITRTSEPVGAVALGPRGRIVLSTPKGLVREDGSELSPLPHQPPNLRMNDGKPDPAGRFVGGTMTLGDARRAAGSLWSFDGSGGPVELITGATIPNGLAWSDDGGTMYWIDTPTQRIDAFDYDLETGGVSERRAWVEIAPELGSPDGMCIDSEGALWVALWGGFAVHRYADAKLDHVIEIPTPLVTCPTFVGPDLDLLVVTTASVDFDDPPDGAGDVYIASPGIEGVAPNRLGPWAER